MKPITIGKQENGAPLTLDVRRLITSRLLITAGSGGGKSWLLRKILEEVSASTQTLVIDPEGEFSSLRELRDMVLVGPDGDLPADPRSAGTLARRLMERNVSAVMDIFELEPKQRREFVANFCRAMVDMDKKYWRNCFIAIDEAHEFAGENESYESNEPVAQLFSKGRKRGYCPIVATQRLSKISKDLAAEARTRFIGLQNLDLDQKRSADFLGFGKQRWTDLRDLSPPGQEGQFYGVGPALSQRGVIKFRTGQVKTTHPEPGQGAMPQPPEPSKKIQSALSELTDLAKQADEEARTLADAKAQIADLRRQLRDAGKPKTVEVASRHEAQQISALRKGLKDAMKLLENAAAGEAGIAVDPQLIRSAVDGAVTQIIKALESQLARRAARDSKFRAEATVALERLRKLLAPDIAVEAVPGVAPQTEVLPRAFVPDADPAVAEGLTNPEQRVLDAIAFWESVGLTQPLNVAVALKSGYSPKSSGYEKPRGSLRVKGLISYPSAGTIELTEDGRSKANSPTKPSGLAELHSKILSVLDSPKQAVLKPLLTIYPATMSNEELAAAAGYSPKSSGYEKPRGGLRSLGLIESKSDGYAATSVLFPPGLAAGGRSNG